MSQETPRVGCACGVTLRGYCPACGLLAHPHLPEPLRETPAAPLPLRTGGYLDGTADEWRWRYGQEYDIVASVWVAVDNGAGYPGESLKNIVADYKHRAEHAEAQLTDLRSLFEERIREVQALKELLARGGGECSSGHPLTASQDARTLDD